jgi:hypothetical protein
MRGISGLLFLIAISALPKAHADACQPYRMVESVFESVPNNSQSFIWRIQKPGVKDSYLVGTFHAAQAVQSWEGLTVLMSELKTFAAETHFSAEAGREFANKSIDRSFDLKTSLGDELFSLGQTIAAKYGLDLNSSSFKPWALFLNLARPVNVTATLDAYLQAQAQDQSLPTIGLQTATEMVDSIEVLSREQQLQILKETICNYDIVQDQSTRLEKLYLNDDVAGFLKESVRLSSPVHGLTESMSTALVTNRNLVFLPRLTPILEEGGALVAVGALHLFGKGGLLELLKAQDFQLAPLDRADFMQQLLDQANQSMPDALSPLVNWLRNNTQIPAGYRPPSLHLVSSAEMKNLGCTGNCAMLLRNGTLWVSEITWNDLKIGEEHFRAVLLGYLIRDVQQYQSPNEKNCTYWQQKNVESLLLRSKYLNSKGLPAAGLGLLPIGNCVSSSQ